MRSASVGMQAAVAAGCLAGWWQLGTSLVQSALGLPGRATGGPVSPGRAYLVGERGPEVFLPTTSGQVMAGAGGQGGRDVRVSITVNGGGADARRRWRAVRGRWRGRCGGALGD